MINTPFSLGPAHSRPLITVMAETVETMVAMAVTAVAAVVMEEIRELAPCAHPWEH